MTFSLRYANKVRGVVLAAGTDGIGHHKLHQKTRTPNFPSQSLWDLLSEWQRRGWVDRFTIRPDSLRPITIWRATELLVTEWAGALQQVEQAVGVASNPGLSDQDHDQFGTSDPEEVDLPDEAAP